MTTTRASTAASVTAFTPATRCFTEFYGTRITTADWGRVPPGVRSVDPKGRGPCYPSGSESVFASTERCPLGWTFAINSGPTRACCPSDFNYLPTTTTAQVPHCTSTFGFGVVRPPVDVYFIDVVPLFVEFNVVTRNAVIGSREVCCIRRSGLEDRELLNSGPTARESG